MAQVRLVPLIDQALNALARHPTEAGVVATAVGFMWNLTFNSNLAALRRNPRVRPLVEAALASHGIPEAGMLLGRLQEPDPDAKACCCAVL
jgi:hypothetical protein